MFLAQKVQCPLSRVITGLLAYNSQVPRTKSKKNSPIVTAADTASTKIILIIIDYHSL